MTGIPPSERHNNNAAYQISLVGNGPNVSGVEFPDEQKLALISRVRYWMNELGIPLEMVKGHYEIEPHVCPGVDMDDVRNNWL